MWISDQEHDLGHVNVSSPSATTLVCPWLGPRFLSFQNGGSLLLGRVVGKGLDGKYFRLCGPRVSVAATQLCCCIVKIATISK